MPVKKRDHNIHFTLKLIVLLIILLFAVGLMPRNKVTGGLVYERAVGGVWIGEMGVTESGTIFTPVVLDTSRLKSIRHGEDISLIIGALQKTLNVEKIKGLLKKNFESPFKDANTPTSVMVNVLAGGHREFERHLTSCLRKLSYKARDETEFLVTSRPVYSRGKIQGYNAEWVYAHLIFNFYLGKDKVCQVKSNCLGSVKEGSGEMGKCW